jgi:hypothetical protein
MNQQRSAQNSHQVNPATNSYSYRSRDSNPGSGSSGSRDRGPEDFSFGGQYRRAAGVNDAAALGLRGSRFGGAGRSGRGWGSVSNSNSGSLRVRETRQDRMDRQADDGPGLSGLGMSQLGKENIARNKKSWLAAAVSPETPDSKDAARSQARGADASVTESDVMERTAARLTARMQQRREREEEDRRERSEFFQSLKEGDSEQFLSCCVCMHVCMYVCMYTYIYIYIYIYIYNTYNIHMYTTPIPFSCALYRCLLAYLKR